MALTPRRSHPVLTRLHFLLRFLGLTGLLAALAAAAVAWSKGLVAAPDDGNWRPVAEGVWAKLLAAAQGRPEGGTLEVVAAYAFLGGLALAALALVVELLVVLRLTAARRSAFGLNAAVQAAIAIALVVGINVFSFSHYERVDYTRDGRFTLDPALQEQLKNLRGETTIVVLQQRRQRGGPAGDQGAYADAAEAAVIERVRDFADQLRDYGPDRFQVVLLDAGKKEFPRRLAQIERADRKLAEAIRQAPGNSIFFHAKEADRSHVQRIGFDDFYQLNLQRSLEADGGKGNLVLLRKDVAPLARRILNLQERRPRVGVLVVHEQLSTQEKADEVGLAGLREALVRQGFEVRDVVLKRNHRRRQDPVTRQPTWGWDPAAATTDEARFDQLTDRRDALDRQAADSKRSVAELRAARERLAKAKEDDLLEVGRKLGVLVRNERERKAWLERIDLLIRDEEEAQKELAERKGKAEEELAGLSADVIGEQRRMTDVEAKLRRLVSDCDLLLVPRLTLIATDDSPIFDPRGLHRLEDGQLQVIKEFVASGKPLLACLGPVVEPPAPTFPGAAEPARQPDGLESLLAELNIRVDGQTVGYKVQVGQYAQEETGRLAGVDRTVPRLDFRTPHTVLRHPGSAGGPAREDNPLRRSLARTAEAWGGDLDLQMRFPRPVYYDASRAHGLLGRALAATPLSPLAGAASAVGGAEGREAAGEFLWTSADSWSAEQPFRELERRALRGSQPSDKEGQKEGALAGGRYGPFPVGVAVEAEIPEGWKGTARTARVAVVGHAGFLTGSDLSPASEKLLLDTCNWLLGRDDLLTLAAGEWRFPRLAVAEQDRALWLWGACLGLPLLFAWLGVVVLLSRQVR
jgi:hypothetical protein